MGNKKTIIVPMQRTKTDPSFVVDDAVVVRFMNVGQSIAIIDYQEFLYPGEAFVDSSPHPIEHSYYIEFLENPDPPAQNVPLVYPGNNLKIRLSKIVEK